MSYTIGLRKKLKSTGGYRLLESCAEEERGGGRRGGRGRGEEEKERWQGRERKGKWAMTRPSNTK